MLLHDRLSAALCEYSVVCQLMENPEISADSLFYLAQFRELLEMNIHNMRRDAEETKAA